MTPWTRTSMPESGNPWYNREATGSGYSCNIQGSPTYPGLNVLCNCTGLACGAFNETYVKNMELLGNHFSSTSAQCFPYKFRSNANLFIEGIYDPSKNHNDTSISVLRPYVRSATQAPPRGGIIVWGNGANHVAYISKVFDNDTIEIQQSAYGGANWSGDTTKGAWYTCIITRNNKGTNRWWYQNTGSGSCLGFIANPGVVAVEQYQPAITTQYGNYIKDRFSTPYIYHNGKWTKSTPYAYHNGKWTKSIK